MHVIPPVLVLAEGATVACLVATTAGLGSLTTTVPATLGGGEHSDQEKGIMAIIKLTCKGALPMGRDYGITVWYY